MLMFLLLDTNVIAFRLDIVVLSRLTQFHICKLTNAINHLISPPEYYKPCTIVHGQVNWTILFFSQSITRM